MKIELGCEKKRERKKKVTPSSHSPLFSRLNFTPSFLIHGHICCGVVFSRGCREFSTLVPGVPFFLLLLAPWCLHRCSSHIFPYFSLPDNIFYPFLNTLSLMCHLLVCGAQLCPAVSQLDLAGTVCRLHGTAPASSHSSHPAAPAAVSIWAPAPNTSP